MTSDTIEKKTHTLYGGITTDDDQVAAASKHQFIREFRQNWDKGKAVDRIAMIRFARELEPDQGLELVFFAMLDLSRTVRLTARETMRFLADKVTVGHSEAFTVSREKTMANETFSQTIIRELKKTISLEDSKDYLQFLLSINGRGPSLAWSFFLSNIIQKNVFIDILRRLPEQLRLNFVIPYLFSEITDRRRHAPSIGLILKDITDIKAAASFFHNVLEQPGESLNARITRTGLLLFDFAERLDLVDTMISRGISSGNPDEILSGALMAGAFDKKTRLHDFLSFLDPVFPATLRTAILSVIERSRTEGDLRVLSAVSRLIHDKNEALVLSAFATLITLDARGSVDTALELIQKRPSLRQDLYKILTRFNAEDLIAVLDRLPDDLALEARQRVARILLKEKPDKMDVLFGHCRTDADPEIRQAAETLFQQITVIRAREKQERIRAFTPGSLTITDAISAEGKILKYLKKPSDYPGLVDFTGEFLQGADLQGAKIENMDLSHVVFLDCDLSSASFSNCILKGARFENVSMVNGHFEKTDLAAAVFVNVDGASCCFRDCFFFNATFYDSRFEFADMSGNAFSGTRFLSCDFSKCDFSGSSLACAVFSLGDFNHATVHQSDFYHTRAMLSDFKGMNLKDAAVFQHTNLDERSALWDSLALPQVFFDKKRLDTRWLNILVLTHGMERQREVFLSHNARLRERALDAFRAEQEDLFDLVPFLIHLTQRILPIEKQGDIPAAMGNTMLKKACAGISNYTPSQKTVALAKKYLRMDKILLLPGKECNIEGLFTIGSVGTIAQSSTSDLDYWVCVDRKNMDPDALTLLRYKLESIEKWAKSRFGTDMHFFVVDPESVREGRFGESDFESSGSAQGMILKEEFYRTMILVEGKIPFWCVLPSWSDQRYYPLLYSIASKFHDDYLDLGHVSSIPPGEYFGASMWQLFKSLTSPYKSVMKMALLEKYIQEGKKGLLLCNLLKQRWSSGKYHFRREDPYIILFEEITDFYSGSDQDDIVNLVRLCFFLKLSIPSPRQLEQSVFKIRKLIVGKCLEGYGWDENELYDLGNFSDWPYDKVLDLSSRINRFMIRTYHRLNGVLNSLPEAETMITAEDLTILGRKMFVQFSSHPHKVQTLPHSARGRGLFRQLYLYYRQYPGKKAVWDVYPFYNKQIMTAGNEDAIIRDVVHIEEVAAFVVHNGIYSSGTGFNILPNPSSVSAQDFNELLKDMNDFFPFGEGDNIAPESFLEPFKIVKLYIVANFSLGKKSERVYEFAAVYMTSWGEVFCRAYKSSAGFSTISEAIENVEKDLGLSCQDVKTGCYVPRMTRRRVMDIP